MIEYAKLENIKKIVIVVGCQRSGTTLLAQILGAPSNAIMLDEDDDLYNWFQSFVDGLPDSGTMWNKVLSKARHKYGESHRRIVQDPYQNFTPASNVNCLVLKAPNLTYNFDEISNLPIPVSVVYPIRDPRAVVASMMQLNHIDMIGNQLALLNRHEDLLKEFADKIALLSDDRQLPCIRRKRLHISPLPLCVDCIEGQ